MSIRNRLDRLEAQAAHDAEPPRALVVIQSADDGKFRHDGRVFESREALERAFPTLFVICAEVYDGRKPTE